MLFLVFGFVKQARFHLQNIERFAANHPQCLQITFCIRFIPVFLSRREAHSGGSGVICSAPIEPMFTFGAFVEARSSLSFFVDLLQCHFHFRNFGRHSRHFLTLAKVICRFASRFRAVIFQNMGDLQELCGMGG